MPSQLAEAIRQLTQEKGISEEAVLRTIENTLKAAYKRAFGTSDNCIVRFSEDNSSVDVFSRKIIVDGVYDPVVEIELEDALKLSPDCEIGDELDIAVDPSSFDRSAVQTGKQTVHQALSEIQKDSLYAEYKDKVGEIIIGYYQREKNGTIYVDLGKVEGILPAKNQSPREVYHKNDRIKALVTEVKKTNTGLQLVLSRTDADFVRKIIELEVPETYDKTVEIYKIVREPGYRTKVAVYSRREDIDPVGACVGVKGSRIHGIVRELRNENIDVINYTSNIQLFIQRALSPAKVSSIVMHEDEKKAEVYLKPEEVSLAIGKGGLNIKLASMLTEYTIDVYRELGEDAAADEDIYLDEFKDEIDEWVINAIKGIGIDTAKGVLNAPREMLIEKADLEENTVDDVLRILKAEFEE